MDILSKIIARKRMRIEAAKRSVLEEPLRQRAAAVRRDARPHALLTALNGNSEINLIAEFKRCSPSKGMIREHANPTEMARAYEAGGAKAISVLTEEDFFGGSLGDLCAARKAVSIPILRKDFVVDDYQVFESAAAGADAILLIVAALPDDSLARLLKLTQLVGMDALVEVHDKSELKRALAHEARLIGVNNRNLRTFEVSTNTSRKLAALVPPDVVLVSESGLTPAAVRDLNANGYRGFLVGETLMRSDDPAAAVRAFIGKD